MWPFSERTVKDNRDCCHWHHYFVIALVRRNLACGRNRKNERERRRERERDRQTDRQTDRDSQTGRGRHAEKVKGGEREKREIAR